MDMSIYPDLKIRGDDVGVLFLALENQFNVCLESVDFGEYFLMQEGLPLYTAMIRRVVPKKTMKIHHLFRAVELGNLSDALEGD
jgi:Protein of unknown function (DUF1493)